MISSPAPGPKGANGTPDEAGLASVPAPVAGRDERWLPAFFLTVWLGHVALCTIGWDHTLIGDFEFRQVQTAISTLFFPLEGFRLAYETPLFGPPWSVPLEFPVYQASVAWFAGATGLPLDAAGRVVSWLYFQLSLPALFLLLGTAGVRRPLRWLCLSLLLTSPLHLFFSRAFLIESTVLCFSAWFLAGFCRWVDRGRLGWLSVALVAGVLGACVKVTTMMVFGVAAAIHLASRWWLARRDGAGTGRVLGRGAVAFSLPVAGGLAWLAFSTAVRARNPDAEILSGLFGFWSFGDVAQRLSLEFWSRIVAVWSDGLVTQAGLVLGLFLFARLRSPHRTAALAAFAAFLSGPLILSNLYFVHAYYFYANGVFLVLALGLMLAAHFEDAGTPRWARWALPLVIVALQLSAFFRDYLPAQRTNHLPTELMQVLRDVTQPDQMVVVLGQDWNGVIPYYAARRALMLAAGRERDPEAIARSVARLDPADVGAVLLFGHVRNDPIFVERALGHLQLGSTPVLTGNDLQASLWIPRSRAPAVRAGLPARLYATLDVVPEVPASGAPVGPLGAREISQNRGFSVLAQAPIRAESPAGFSLGGVGDIPALNAHSPSELVFHRSAGLKRITLRFGIYDGAFANPAGSTDGVEFTVALVAADGTERQLFSRLLEPLHRPADRGLQEAEVPVPAGDSGEIRIRTLPGPQGNPSYDWAFWTAIEME